MPIDLIPKKAKALPVTKIISRDLIVQNKSIAFALVLVLVVLLSYVGLRFWAGKTQEQAERVAQLSRELQGQIDHKQAREARSFAERAGLLEGKIKTHIYASPAFSLIENSLHSFTFLTTMKADLNKETLVIKGQTATLRTLAEQTLLWEQDKNITKVALGGFGPNKAGRIEFSATLNLVPGLFTKP